MKPNKQALGAHYKRIKTLKATPLMRKTPFNQATAKYLINNHPGHLSVLQLIEIYLKSP